MRRKNKSHNYGFTLGELLVAIAVISVLSTVVMVSSKGSQEKALNAKRLNLIEQYVTAIEMYRQDNGGYPDIYPRSSCVGDEPDDVCGDDVGTRNTEQGDFLDMLRPYMPELQPFPDLKLINPRYVGPDTTPTHWDGAVYSCVTVPGCKRYSITWFMQGPERQECGIGYFVEQGDTSDDTRCSYTSMRFD